MTMAERVERGLCGESATLIVAGLPAGAPLEIDLVAQIQR